LHENSILKLCHQHNIQARANKHISDYFEPNDAKFVLLSNAILVCFGRLVSCFVNVIEMSQINRCGLLGHKAIQA